MADLIEALQDILKADVDIAALAGARVFGGELPKSETKHMPRPAIVLKRSGGVSLTGGTFAEHDTQRIDAHYYGATPNQAMELARLGFRVFRRLKRSVVSGVLVHWINSAGGASDGRDRDGKWPVSFRSYQVFHALEEI